jgi:hypothetical protein
MLGRLVEQVERYAALVDEHAEGFARLFGTTLGENVRFDAPAERWIVWPEAGPGMDPREAELRARGIRVVSYREVVETYSFRVGGRAVTAAASSIDQSTPKPT